MIAALRTSLVLTLLFAVGCGEAAPPAPAAVPEEFDDPFADDAKEGTKPEEPAKAEPETKVAVAEPAAPAEPSAVVPSAEPAAGAEAKVEGTPPATAVAEDAGKTAKTGEAPATEKTAKKAKTEAVPKDKSPTPSEPSKPVPADTPAPAPEPTPAPEPKTEPTPAPAPAPPPQPEQNRFAGTFRYSGGQAQRDNLEAAIEAAAQELNALIRGIGRKRLTEANPIREQMTFAIDGTKVTATFAAGRTVSGTLGGPAVPWTSDSGKPLTVAFSLVKGRLVLTYVAEDGGRRSVFTLDESGDKLTMSVTVTSERLTNPLKYALTYKRN